MSEHYNIRSLIKRRSKKHSYHMASEQHVRVQFFNMTVGKTLGPFVYEGDLVITCYGGAFVLSDGGASTDLTEMDQAVVPAGSRVSLECGKEGTIQIIWAPAFATVVKG